ncbi:MAG TPA: MFS transporter [Gammaproteobacteria bacterium]|nr:MFS transporter [Gammaproteobacteria bacterium]
MLERLFESLRLRDFRIYFLGQMVSITGTWMQNVAQAWLVYRLTESSFLLGFVAFVGLMPVLVFGLAGGVVADRYPRKALMVAAQTVALLQAVTLAVLTLTGWVEVWHIIALAFLLGVVHAFEMPTRHSFLAEIVPRGQLANAIALNSSLFNLARSAGPAIAGWLVAASGEGVVFAINAGTFLLMLIGLWRIRMPASGTERPGRRPGALAEGLRYAAGHPRIRAALLLLASVSLLSTGYSVLMPVFSKTVFGGGPTLLGMLLGSAGLGALVAALRLAYLSGRQQLDRQIGGAVITAGVAMAGFAATDYLPLAMALLAVVGFALTTLIASTNTLLQMLVADTLRGRVMSLFSVLFIGANSIGNLLAGTIADRVGAPTTVLVFGMTALALGTVHRLHAPRLAREGGAPEDKPEREADAPTGRGDQTGL